MFGPRPDPIPESLIPVSERLTDWSGPAFPLDELPQFEISYEGGKTEYLKVSMGAEAKISDEMLPADLSKYDLHWLELSHN